MARELRPGVFGAIFDVLKTKAHATGQVGLTSLALAIERQAKDNLTQTSHPYRTPTPAHPGGPPALVSGTLRRSISHTRPELGAFGWSVRVGVAAGFYPPYGGKNRTSSSQYGKFLEADGLRNGAKYPFLKPAFDAVVHGVGETTIARWFAQDWLSL